MKQENKNIEALLIELQDLKQENTLLKNLHIVDLANERKKREEVGILFNAIEQSTDLTFITTFEGIIEYVNKSVYELTGYNKEELIGKNMSIFKSGNITKEGYETIFKILKDNGTWKGEFINKKKNGELYYVQNKIFAILNIEGKITQYISVQEDITQSKIQEEKINHLNENLKKIEFEKETILAESNKVLNKIADGVPGVIYQYKLRPDGTSCFPYSSKGIKAIYRVNPEDIVNDASSVFFAIHPDDMNAVIESIQKSAKTLTLWNCKYRVKFDDGTLRWVQGNSMPEMEADGSILWNGNIIDITDAKKVEDDLAYNQSLLNLMANSSPLGFLVVDNRNDEILFSNNRFCEIWGIEHLAEKMKKGEVKNNDIIPDCLAVLVDIPAFAESCKPLQDENNRIEITDEISFTNNRTIQRFSTQIRGEHDEYFGRFYIFNDISEQKKLVNELAKERTSLSEIIKATNVGTWEWNIHTGETNINERWAEIIGYSLAELEPITEEIWKKYVHPDDTIASLALLEKHFEGEHEYYSFESRMKHKNGHWVWVLERGKVNKRDINGKPLLMSGFNLDITENKKILEDLKESQETHRALSEATFDPIFFSEKGICIQQNEAAKKIFGYTDEEALGKFGTDWIKLEDRAKVMRNMLNGYEEPYEANALKKDGTTFPCMVRGKMMYYKGRDVRVTSIRDISIQKQAEQALLESQVQFAKFMDYLPALVFIKDSESKMIYGNNAMDKALGSSNWVNKSMFELFDNVTAERIILDDKKTLESKYEIFEESFPNLDGTVHNYETQKFTIPIPGKEPLIGGIALDITLRKQAEEKFSKAFESNSMFMIISSLETGKIIDMNQKALETIVGLPKEEVIGKTSVELGLFNNWAEREEIFKEILDKNVPELFQREVKFESKSKGTLTFLTALNKINIGNELCILISMVDITDRKKLDAKLFESEEKLRTIIETSPDGIIISSLKGIVQFVTKKTTNMFGYEKMEELLSRSIFDFFDTISHENVTNFINEIKKGNITVNAENRMLCKDGSTFCGELNANILRDKNNKPSGILFVMRNINDRKQIQNELADTALRMKLATQSGGVGIWDYNLEKDILIWDEQMYKLYGINKDTYNINFKSGSSLVHPDDIELVNAQFKIALNEGSEFNINFRIIRPDGNIRFINAQAVLQYDELKKPIHVLGTNRDITIKILAEFETNKARNAAEEANKAKSEFLSRMSHELRTPLNSILGFAQIMDMGELTTNHKKGVDHILKSGNHLLGLINEVLDLSKIETGYVINKLEDVNILDNIYQIIDDLEPAILDKKINVEVIHSFVIPIILKSDNKLISQVLINLLNNAIKYNQTSGTIKIETTIIDSITNENKLFKIAITDTGKGISKENIQKLFNPFERIGAEDSGIEGTGLGLSVVKNLVKVLNGNVGIESEIGVGSTFWFTLPMQSNNDIENGEIEALNKQLLKKESLKSIPERDPLISEVQIVHLKNKQFKINTENDLINKKGIILCIEDHVMNIELMKHVIQLKRPNIEIIVSLTGQETVQLAIQHQPDLILLDLNLPNSHGSIILKNLQKNKFTKHIPVIILSADATKDQFEKNMKLGAKKYLTKPLDLTMFIETIDKWIGNKN